MVAIWAYFLIIFEIVALIFHTFYALFASHKSSSNLKNKLSIVYVVVSFPDAIKKQFIYIILCQFIAMPVHSYAQSCISGYHATF